MRLRQGLRLRVQQVMQDVKITREVFVYFERPLQNFAQCGTCALRQNGTCLILDALVPDQASCSMYVPNDKGTLSGIATQMMTPDEAGYVQAAVRCQNCAAFNAKKGGCELYYQLNQVAGFDLDEKVKPNGCCNAWQPKALKVKDGVQVQRDAAGQLHVFLPSKRVARK